MGISAGWLAGEGENRQSSVTSEELISSKPAPVSRTQDTKQEGHPSSVPLSSFTSQLETCSVMCVPLISTTSIITRIEGLQISLIEVLTVFLIYEVLHKEELQLLAQEWMHGSTLAQLAATRRSG